MKIIKYRKLASVITILLLLSFLVAGCGKSKVTSVNPNTPSTPPASETGSQNTGSVIQTTTLDVTLYFPTADAEGLVPVARKITVTDTNLELIPAIFKEFSAPPAGLVAPLPKSTKLLDAKIDGGIATINLSKDFKANFEGGATGEEMVIYSITNTLTSLPDVKSVKFLLEGELKVAILGALDTSTPVEPNESLIVKK